MLDKGYLLNKRDDLWLVDHDSRGSSPELFGLVHFGLW